MRTHHRSGLVAAKLMLTVVGLLSAVQALAADPNFSNVTDVLSGKRQLLRVDDLAVVADTQPNPNLQVTNVSVLQTEDAKIVKVLPPDTIGRADAPYGPTSRVAMGRVFHLPNDVVAAALARGRGLIKTRTPLSNRSKVPLTPRPIAAMLYAERGGELLHPSSRHGDLS